jgi:hypothetical protein
MKITLAPFLLVAGLALPAYTQASESATAGQACEFILLHPEHIIQFYSSQPTRPQPDSIFKARTPYPGQRNPAPRVYHF